MATTPAFYCTQADIEARMSVEGVKLRVDDTGDSTAQATAIRVAIEEATVEVNNYCLTQYDVPGLTASNWVRQKAIRLAMYYLCLRRNNKAPASVAAQYEQAIDQLEAVQSGSLRINDTYSAKFTAPSVSNQRVMLTPVPELVTVPSRSTGQQTDTNPRNDPWDY